MKTHSKSDRKHGKILGVDLNSTSSGGVIAFVKYRVEKELKFYIVTPNPEIVLASERDGALLKALNSAHLSLPDGIGLAQASRFLSLKVPRNIILRLFLSSFQGLFVGGATFFKKDWLTSSLPILPGRETFLELISLANKNSWKVFLLGGERGLAKRTAEKLAGRYKKARFEFNDGPKLGKDGNPDTEIDILIQKRCLEEINQFKPKLLFIALGPTKQEKWIARNISKLDIGGAMVVGGTFNYIAGVSKLPPAWIENFGLEWVWRLITEPWRLRRILNAFPIFPVKVFWYKVKNND